MHMSLHAVGMFYIKNLLRVAAMILSMGTNVVNNKNVVSGTCREDSVTSRLSSLRVPQDLE